MSAQPILISFCNLPVYFLYFSILLANIPAIFSHGRRLHKCSQHGRSLSGPATEVRILARTTHFDHARALTTNILPTPVATKHFAATSTVRLTSPSDVTSSLLFLAFIFPFTALQFLCSRLTSLLPGKDTSSHEHASLSTPLPSHSSTVFSWNIHTSPVIYGSSHLYF